MEVPESCDECAHDSGVFLSDGVLFFATEVGGYFAPLVGVPFDDGVACGVGFEPIFGAFDEVEEDGVIGCGGDRGACVSVAHPCDCRAAVGVDGDVVSTELVEPSEGMDDGKEFADVV